ncbi:MAG: hypothetical protein OHK0012_09340 [Synechococcales cyanobacterium]
MDADLDNREQQIAAAAITLGLPFADYRQGIVANYERLLPLVAVVNAVHLPETVAPAFDFVP